MKKLFFLLLFVMTYLSVNASQVVFTGGIKITMPDTYKQKDSNIGDVVAFDTLTGNWLLSSKASLKKYDRSKLYDSMDTVMYKLADYTLIDSESEWFFEWGKDYEKRFYVSDKENSKKVMTYTFADVDYCYCMFFQYDTEEELKTINDSIEKIGINLDFWEIFEYLFKCAPFYWFCFLIICLFCGVALWSEGVGGLIGLIVCACAVLLVVLWGEWLWLLLAAAVVNLLVILSPAVMLLLNIFGND